MRLKDFYGVWTITAVSLRLYQVKPRPTHVSCIIILYILSFFLRHMLPNFQNFEMMLSLCTIILFLILQTSFALAVDFYYRNCSVPTTCGGHIISFPFIITGRQQRFCGYPGFQLSCNEVKGYPILSLGGYDYIVHNISYQNQTLLVSNAALSNLNTSDCIPLVQNLTLPSDRYVVAPNQKKILLLYDCNSSSSSDDESGYTVGCFTPTRRIKTTSVLVLPGDDEQLFDDMFETCGSKVVVKLEYASNDSVESGSIVEVLKRGFMLKWYGSNCSRCELSGGKCGFDYSNSDFKCFCPDMPHSVSCKGKGYSRRLILKRGLGVLAGAVALVIIFFFYLFLMKHPRNRQIDEAFLRNYGPLQVKRYTYTDVKKMTNSFKHKLGQGGYGGVYKGKMKDGGLVAVKVLNRTKGNGEEFMNEVAAISRTSHVNIVSLLGFCFEGSKRALLYEFMPNGSLEKFIFDANNSQKDQNLGWEAMDRIAVGIARGLEYLHRGCNTRILHFDIKPHNILLDENFSPKISDFGLAKICDRKDSIVSMTGARGTAGYIAPEVFCRNFGRISHKSDVYSYGMMLSEMVGGRRNIDSQAENTSEIYFPHWIYKRLELDEELGLKSIMNEEDKGRARKMIIVSLWCIQTDPSNRPSMKQVIEMLEGSVESLQIPPKPYLSSPPKSPAVEDSSSTIISLE